MFMRESQIEQSMFRETWDCDFKKARVAGSSQLRGRWRTGASPLDAPSHLFSPLSSFPEPVDLTQSRGV